MLILRTILVFILAGICEIGGGYLVWLSVKEGKSVWYIRWDNSRFIWYYSHLTNR